MLREATNAGFEERRSLLGRHYRLLVGEVPVGAALRRGAWLRLQERQEREPVLVGEEGERRYWMFGGQLWWEREDLDVADVHALLAERQRRKERQLERARGALARAADEDGATAAGRPAIPREVRLAVYERDGGRCVECGAGALLQYDHVIPLALGGSSEPGNLQLLCDACNRAKGASLA